MLGPHEELARTEYQVALRNAYRNTKPSIAATDRVQLTLSVEAQNADAPFLMVETEDDGLVSPTISLWSTFGGAALCKDHALEFDSVRWKASIPLVRRVTNNRYLGRTYRSGATYKLVPLPQEQEYADRYHTKLIDGRAYGYFGTTAAWPTSQSHASVDFDLHRPYRIVKVEVAQPTKLEERVGGPAELSVAFSREPPTNDTTLGTATDSWSEPRRLLSTFPVHVGDASEPDNPSDAISDPRHNRAWLSWAIDVPRTEARRIRLSATRVRANSSISLGEVVIHAIVDGEVYAQIKSDGQIASLKTNRYTIVIP
jgi:hypothetical protein